jgi:hypothetical protein
VLNAALLGGLAVLAFDPQRRAFGRATGLWHGCSTASGGGSGYERWSSVLLLLLIPAGLGFVVAARSSRPTATALLLVSGILGGIAVVFVVVPTAGCIA